MERVNVIFKGQVQSVGFRAYCKRWALEYNLTGFVKNHNDMQFVEAEFQGDINNINNCIYKLVEGNMFIQIIDYSVKALPIKPLEKAFSIIY